MHGYSYRSKNDFKINLQFCLQFKLIWFLKIIRLIKFWVLPHHLYLCKKSASILFSFKLNPLSAEKILNCSQKFNKFLKPSISSSKLYKLVYLYLKIPSPVNVLLWLLNLFTLTIFSVIFRSFILINHFKFIP